METTLRSSSPGGALGAVRGGATTPLAPARVVPAPVEERAAANEAAARTAPASPRRSATSIGGGLQEGVARAQQALDYLERVAGQLENLKSQLSAKLAASRAGRGGASPQLDTQVRQLASTLAARRQDGGGGLDADLNFDGQPAAQRFRIRGIDLDTLQQGAPQSVAFSVGGIGGPQLSASITPGQTREQSARALDRALAPLGVRAGLDDGALVFSTAESTWPAVQDSIAVSGRGRVATETVAPAMQPQQWDTGNVDSLRQSLREVVQALERVRRSQDAAGNALSSASVEVAQSQTPPPDIELAADDFAQVAAGTDYASLLSLTSALVGVSRERVLALLGLR